MEHYLFILGRNTILSRAELQHFCTETVVDQRQGLLLAEEVQFVNPRNLPKSPEQVLQDRLGGVIRMGKVLGEYDGWKALEKTMQDTMLTQKEEGKLHLAVSGWGCDVKEIKGVLGNLKQSLKEQGRNVRIINIDGKPISSAKIFTERLLRKGFEFLVWKRGDTYLLAQTVANQNLRNYTARDHEKPHRDARVGMLPPKLAQILINLAEPKEGEMVLDPFCGTGTVNVEATLMGFPTIGSDQDPRMVDMAQGNFKTLASTFRYLLDSGEFLVTDAAKFPLEKAKGVVVTEGWLGFPFAHTPQRSEINKNEQEVLRLWERFMGHLERSQVRTVVCTLPTWKTPTGAHSMASKLFAKLEKTAYTPAAIFENHQTILYARPDAFVGREICKLVRK